MLSGYYKFEPLQDDTAFVYVVLVNDEEQIAGEYQSYLYSADQYTLFTLMLDYPAGNTITEVAIVVSTTIYFMQGDGKSGEIGSVLYLDDLRLVSLCETLAPYEIADIELPTCETSIAVIDAGDGWDEYLWSNDETTQVISVDINEESTYSVTVTDTEMRCEFSDEVSIGLPLGCDNVEEIDNQLADVSVYPNPASGMFTLEFQNIDPGNYWAEVIDITGKSLIREKFDINQSVRKFTFDMSEYPEGLYLIRIVGIQLNHCQRVLLK
jgi:hypothetical protein